MKTLTRYIGREVLLAILLIFGALIMLFAFFDLIHELGDVGKADYTLGTALLVFVLFRHQLSIAGLFARAPRAPAPASPAA